MVCGCLCMCVTLCETPFLSPFHTHMHSLSLSLSHPHALPFSLPFIPTCTPFLSPFHTHMHSLFPVCMLCGCLCMCVTLCGTPFLSPSHIHMRSLSLSLSHPHAISFSCLYVVCILFAGLGSWLLQRTLCVVCCICTKCRLP